MRSVDTVRSVGYGASHQATRSAKIATVAIGYGDGYLRALSNAGTAFIDSHEVPVVGRVSMDLVIFDVTGVPDEFLRPGGDVELIGPGHDVDDLARLVMDRLPPRDGPLLHVAGTKVAGDLAGLLAAGGRPPAHGALCGCRWLCQTGRSTRG